MRLAAETWALVVGIDQYDDPALTVLDSPVLDAVRAVRWLRELGVPPSQIFLHAIPGRRENAGALDELVGELVAVDASWQMKGRADIPNLWRSLVSLSKKSGDRLFVFLFGHGFHELGSGRLFLTQEASRDFGWRNLGLDIYIQYLLSFAFSRQFMIVNACQNHPLPMEYRPQVVAEFFDPTLRGAPVSGNSLLACYAASRGQYVREVEGHSLFTQALFDAIDLREPHPAGVKFDATSGVRSLHLRPLMENHLIDVVVEEARKAQLDDQKPVFSPTLIDHMQEPALCEIPTDTLELEVDVDPANDAGLLRMVRVEQAEPFPWQYEHPARGRPLHLPAQHRIPAGARITVYWALRSASQGRRSVGVDEVTVDHDLRHVIRLTASSEQKYSFVRRLSGGKASLSLFSTGEWNSHTHLELRTLNSEGASLQGWERHYEQIAEILDREKFIGPHDGEHPGFVVFVSDYGLDVLARPRANTEARQFLQAVSEVARGAFDDADLGEVALVIREVHEIAGEIEIRNRTSIRVRLPDTGAVGLAGFLAQAATVTVSPLYEGEAGGSGSENERPFSLSRLASDALVGVSPGLYRVRLTLPWGGWNTVVQARSGEETTVSLPRVVGSPPLRLRLHGERARFSQLGDLLFGIDGAPPILRSIGHTLGLIEGIRIPRGTSAWAMKLQTSPDMRGQPVELQSAEGRVRFPLAGRSLAVQMASGMRVEPLSDSTLEAWDRLVGKGLLEELTEEDITALLNYKWSDPLLGLAGAYALYARGDWSRLQRVVENLELVVPGVDVDLLRVAAMTGGSSVEWGIAPRDSLIGHARVRNVPLFRWGVPLALDLSAALIDSSEVKEWREGLSEIARGLSVSSVWTAWTPA